MTGFVRAVSNFLERNGLVSVWDKFPIDFTHIHMKSTAILDNFFVSKKLLDLVIDAGPLHLGDNRSRHSPVMMKIELADIPARIQQREAARARKPAWYKATDEVKYQYTSLLEEKLQDIPFPDSYSCRDVNCKMAEHSN